jgi:hypothetical protein
MGEERIRKNEQERIGRKKKILKYIYTQKNSGNNGNNGNDGKESMGDCGGDGWGKRFNHKEREESTKRHEGGGNGRQPRAEKRGFLLPMLQACVQAAWALTGCAGGKIHRKGAGCLRRPQAI